MGGRVALHLHVTLTPWFIVCFGALSSGVNFVALRGTPSRPPGGPQEAFHRPVTPLTLVLKVNDPDF